MKTKLFFVLCIVLLNTVNAFSLDLKDCENNSYKPTTENTVVAIDWADKIPEKKGYIVVHDMFSKLDGSDGSCLSIEILQNGFVTCVEADNKKTIVGKLNKILGRQGLFDFYNVDWISKVYIKSSINNGRCKYAIAL